MLIHYHGVNIVRSVDSSLVSIGLLLGQRSSLIIIPWQRVCLRARVSKAMQARSQKLSFLQLVSENKLHSLGTCNPALWEATTCPRCPRQFTRGALKIMLPWYHKLLTFVNGT